MNTGASFRSRPRRGSVLLTALLFATALALALGGYLATARSSLVNAQRTFSARDALALAEAGLEEAFDSLRQADAGATTAIAWAGWTLTGSDATRTLPSFDRDGRALATVKLFVRGYDATAAAPIAIAQATLVPFDRSPPIVRTVQVALQKQSYFTRGLVARTDLSMSGQAFADSYNSNPTGSATGPWAAYPGTGARANTTVIVPGGSVSLSGQSRINGNLLLGPGVTAPAANKVSGTIAGNFQGTFPMPAYPTAASVSQSYNLGGTIPATLPVSGHQPASDGSYYYFCSGTTIRNVTISANRKVTIVGTTTGLTSGIVLQGGATLTVYIDGALNCGNNSISNSNWAGALRIFTSTSSNCNVGGNGEIVACVYAPNAALSCSGNGMLVGSFVARSIMCSGQMEFHYDEALQLPSVSSPWTVTNWYERRSASDRATLAGLTNNFLQ